MSGSDVMIVISLFYAGWFGSAFLGATEYSAASLLFPVALIATLLLRRQLSAKAFTSAVGVAAVGFLIDLVLIRGGFVVIEGHQLFTIPIWLVSIWLLFSFSLLKLGASLKPPFWLAALLGLVGGPLSYKSGELFGILTFATPVTFLIYAVLWALIFPSILLVARRLA